MVDVDPERASRQRYENRGDDTRPVFVAVDVGEVLRVIDRHAS